MIENAEKCKFPMELLPNEQSWAQLVFEIIDFYRFVVLADTLHL